MTQYNHRMIISVYLLLGGFREEHENRRFKAFSQPQPFQPGKLMGAELTIQKPEEKPPLRSSGL